MRWRQLGLLLCLCACGTAGQPMGLSRTGDLDLTESVPALLQQARSFELAGDWEQAALALDTWARRNPVTRKWDLRRLRAADGAGDRFTASRLRLIMFNADPSDLGLRIDLADDLQAIGDGAAAIVLLEEAAALERDAGTGASMARRGLAEIYLREQQTASAAALFEELAYAAPPGQGEGLALTASSLWEEIGDIEAALRCVELVLNPDELAENERMALARLRAFSQAKPANVNDAVALLRHHQDADARLAGIVYLARDLFPGDLDVFIGALVDSDSRVLQVALNQLGLRGGPTDAECALDFLDHQSMAVRIAACGCLERAGEMAQAPSLLPLLVPENRALFRAARRALQSLCQHRVAIGFDPRLAEREEIAIGWRLWCAQTLNP